MEQDTATLLLELGGVVLGLAVVARLARRFGVPAIPFYLLAGLVFGEGGALSLGAAEGFIETGAEIGLILMLLVLGLEYSADELVGGLRRSARSGLIDLVTNLCPGVIAGLLLGWDPLAAVLLGGVTYISSSGVVAKLLADLGRVGNRETPVVLRLLVLEDLAMAVYLPVVAALLVGGSTARVAVSVAIALGAVGVLLFVALRHGERISRLVWSGSSEALLLTLLGLTLLVAGIAERIQLSAAAGAFLVGIVLSGEVVSHGRGLLLPLRNLFAAVFFVFFGFRVDPGLIPDVAIVATILAVVTAVTKVLTGWWAAAREGIGVGGRARAGTALIARGEFSIVVASLGVGIQADLAAVAATYVLFLAVAGPLLARYADPLVGALRR
ncbi:MAG: cation:proton antiporter [Acidimicrobiales bacterium]